MHMICSHLGGPHAWLAPCAPALGPRDAREAGYREEGMQSIRSMFAAMALGTALILTAHAVLEAVDVKTAHEKAFDFRPMRTWGWNPAAAGHVKMEIGRAHV